MLMFAQAQAQTHIINLKAWNHSVGKLSQSKDSLNPRHDGRPDTLAPFAVRDSSSRFGGTTLYISHNGHAQTRVQLRWCLFDPILNAYVYDDSTISVDSLSTADIEGVQNDSTIAIPLSFRRPKGLTHCQVILSNGPVIPAGTWRLTAQVQVAKNMPKRIQAKFVRRVVSPVARVISDSLTVRQDGRPDTTEPIRLPRDSSAVYGGLYALAWTDGISKGLVSAQFGTWNGSAYSWGAAVVLDSVTTVNSLIRRTTGRHVLGFRKGTDTHVRFIWTDGASALVSSLARKRLQVIY